MSLRQPPFSTLPPALASTIAYALLLVLIVGSSHAQQASTARSERERIRHLSLPSAVPQPSGTGIQPDHNQCLALSVEIRATFLVNRCGYPINALYCHVKNSSPAGCTGQAISLRSGGSAQTAPGAIQKYRWLACRSPARPVETRRRDAYRIRVEWTCVE